MKGISNGENKDHTFVNVKKLPLWGSGCRSHRNITNVFYGWFLKEEIEANTGI